VDELFRDTQPVDSINVVVSAPC